MADLLLPSAAVGGTFLSGGLAGTVGRQAERSAVNAATGYTEGPSIGNALYQSSLEKGGDFANNVISNIAQGNYGQVGSITGEGAEAAFQSYMGISADNKADHSYTNVEIGGGRITGVETTPMELVGNLPCIMLINTLPLLRAILTPYILWTDLPGIGNMHKIPFLKHHTMLVMEK